MQARTQEAIKSPSLELENESMIVDDANKFREEALDSGHPVAAAYICKSTSLPEWGCTNFEQQADLYQQYQCW
jgi:hypothetical protein